MASTQFAEEQDRWKHDAMQMVKQQAYHMKRALDASNLRDALKHSSNMVSELRTSLLSPKNYYELYMLATDELRYLEAFFVEELRTSQRSMLELYELVQHAGNILPRLYLLVTVGAVYIKSQQAPARDILKDLVEMCRGVQHPLRGLFLRNYLSQMSKDKLPDTGNAYLGAGGSVDDSVDFVLSNFAEMNKLWVRIQHQGPVREREKRERERQDLRILVGTNLVRLSQLEGVDVHVYADKVLPRILEQVVSCKDEIAQHYLMECIIQVFPDDFHLHTLEALLQKCTELQPGVDVKGILVSLMARLCAYVKHQRGLGTAVAGTSASTSGAGPFGATGAAAGGAGSSNGVVPPADGGDAAVASRASDADVQEDAPTFALLAKYTGLVISSHQSWVETRGVLQLQLALLQFALGAYPHRRDYVDRVFGFCASFLASVPRQLDPPSVTLVTQVLVAPLDVFKDVLLLLRLANVRPLAAFLPFAMRRAVAMDVARSVVKHNTVMSTKEEVDILLDFVAPLICGEGDTAGAAAEEEVAAAGAEDEDFLEEQGLVCRLLHYFQHEDTDAVCRMLDTAREHLAKGSTGRTRRTMVPLVFRCLEVTRRIHEGQIRAGAGASSPRAGDTTGDPDARQPATDGEDKAADSAPSSEAAAGESAKRPTVSCKKMLEFVHRTIGDLPPEASDVALRLHLQAAQTADGCGLEQIAYEFVTQAFILYEDELSDSRAQTAAIGIASGTLHRMSGFSRDNYETLVTKATQYSAKLLKKPDQCRAILRACQLFWASTICEAGVHQSFAEENRVKECLQRATKVADTCKVGLTHVQLFVEILDTYIYFLTRNVPTVSPATIATLMKLIDEQMVSAKTSADATMLGDVQAHYAAVVRHLHSLKAASAAEGNDDAQGKLEDVLREVSAPPGPP